MAWESTAADFWRLGDPGTYIAPSRGDPTPFVCVRFVPVLILAQPLLWFGVDSDPWKLSGTVEEESNPTD
jgi:hypothetical protein